MTELEKKALKGRGYIATRDGEHFIARIITVDGVLTAQQMEKIAQASEQCGDGRTAMTTRMTVEVQGLTQETIEPFDRFIADAGLYTGGTGSRVRPIMPCKGTVCVHGLIDTQALARDLHETFYQGWYDVKLPHKFKIGISGCPNSCIKADLNDFGIVGQRVPAYDAEDCSGCKKCAVSEKCPMKAAALDEDGIMQIDRSLCNNCGKCVDACPFDCVQEEKAGYQLYVGGYWAKRKRPGNPVPGVFTREEVFSAVEKSLLLYREQGKTGERFGMFIDRIGVDHFMEQLLGGEVLSRRQEILDAQLHLSGGATC